MYSGLAMYMLRPPTSRGMPALGCALSLRRVCGAIFSMHSRIVRTDRAIDADHVGAPGVERARDRVRRSAVRREAVGADRHLRDEGLARIGVARREDRLLDLVEVGKGLEDEQIDAAVDETGHL